MAQQKGMKRAAKVLKRGKRTAKAQHKANVKRLESGHVGHQHGHDHDHDHDHGHDHDHK